jgi:ribonuclease HI
MIKALNTHSITAKLVWNRHQSLMPQAECNRVQLIRVPGHEGIYGNKIADHLVKLGSELTGHRTRTRDSCQGLARDFRKQ